MTASPFCNSESAEAGIRLIICCRSEGPPPDLAIPPDPGLPDGGPPGFVVCSALAREPAPLELGPEDDASGGLPFRRAAIRCAIGGGSLRNCDSAVAFTMMSFFEDRSWTVMVPEEASMAEIVAAMLRK